MNIKYCVYKAENKDYPVRGPKGLREWSCSCSWGTYTFTACLQITCQVSLRLEKPPWTNQTWSLLSRSLQSSKKDKVGTGHYNSVYRCAGFGGQLQRFGIIHTFHLGKHNGIFSWKSWKKKNNKQTRKKQSNFKSFGPFHLHSPKGKLVPCHTCGLTVPKSLKSSQLKSELLAWVSLTPKNKCFVLFCFYKIWPSL